MPLLFGASSAFEVGGRKVKSNSAFLAGEDGMIREVYDKNLLIPLAESLPFGSVLPLLARLFPHAEEFAAATSVPSLGFGPWRIATPICYEAIRPEFVRHMMAAAHPHLLVTLANDAWFGDSQEPWLHLGLARAPRDRAPALARAGDQQRRERDRRPRGPHCRAYRAPHTGKPARDRASARGRDDVRARRRLAGMARGDRGRRDARAAATGLSRRGVHEHRLRTAAPRDLLRVLVPAGALRGRDPPDREPGLLRELERAVPRPGRHERADRPCRRPGHRRRARTRRRARRAPGTDRPGRLGERAARAPRVLQVRQLPAGDLERRGGAPVRAAPRHPSARDLVLHLRDHQLPGRRPSRRAGGALAAALRRRSSGSSRT